MNMQLVGLRATRFTAKDTGAVINGQTLYVSYNDSYVSGRKTDKFFIPERASIPVPNNFPVDIDVQFNRYGKVDSVTIL